MEDTSDLELLAQVRKGDSEAFGRIIQRHHARIYRLVATKVAPEHDREELTQEVFLKAFQNVGAFDARSAVSTWIYRIAANLIIDYYRSKRLPRSRECSGAADAGLPLREVPDLERVGDTRDERPDPQAQAESEELGLGLREALAKLEEPFGSTFRLAYFDGLPYDEIARLQGCSEGTIKSRVNRALARLRQFFGTARM